jgi:hypothetical protein
MRTLRKPFIVFLILLTANLFIARVIFAEQGPTKHPLEIRSTPEEEIPTIKEKKTSGWTWLILIALVGGAAAAAGGGGGEKSSGSSTNGGGDTGSYTGTW